MKKITALILTTLILLSTTSCGSANKELDYETADRYATQGKYEEAIAAFRALGNYKDSASRAVYCEAMSCCEAGDYSSAYNKLTTIQDYSQTSTLLKEIFFETRLFEALNSYKTNLKKPDSLTVSEVMFTYDAEGTKASSKERPACIIRSSAQNGFGGYSSSYTICFDYEEENKYTCYGSCSSLDYDDYDIDEISEGLVAASINGHIKNIEITDAINMDRVNRIIKKNSYSGIKRIPGLKANDISY